MDISAKAMIKNMLSNWRILKRISGSHNIFFHPKLQKTVPIPLHNKDLPKWLYYAILKQITIEEN